MRASRRRRRSGGARADSCGETADIVAVVLASWGSLFAPVPVAVAAAPGVAPEGEAAAGAPAGAAARRVTLGAAAGFAAASGAGTAPVIGIDAGILLSGAWAARIGVAGVGEHEAAFGADSRVSWRRILLLPALAWTWGASGPFAEVSAGPLAGLFLVEGRGFRPNDNNVTVDLGGAAGARLGVRLPRADVAFWLGGGAWAYGRRQEVHADGPAQSRLLPWWEVIVTAGLAWTPGG